MSPLATPFKQIAINDCASPREPFRVFLARVVSAAPVPDSMHQSSAITSTVTSKGGTR